jgi:Xaa-Pro dipeptidase
MIFGSAKIDKPRGCRGPMQDSERLQSLIAAEQKADALPAAIETAGLIAPGRSEQMVEQDIYDLAERSFGVIQHWHRRIVRAGANALCISNQYPPVREIAEDDCVFLDLGPVFGDWEADIGRTYVLGSDPAKLKLRDDLSRGFDALKSYFDGHPDVTGAELYAYAQEWADAQGWVSAAPSPGTSSANLPTPIFPATRPSTGSVPAIHRACAIPMRAGKSSSGYGRSTSLTGRGPSAVSTNASWCRDNADGPWVAIGLDECRWARIFGRASMRSRLR